MRKKTAAQSSLLALPVDLVDVALVDARTCAAAGSMSVSWWHEQVRAGNAPQPAIRGPRCTRWTAAAVRAFWVSYAELADTHSAEVLMTTARKASAAAQAKRKAAKLTATVKRI